MARQARIEYPGAVHHVRSRGNNRQAIFLDDGSVPDPSIPGSRTDDKKLRPQRGFHFCGVRDDGSQPTGDLTLGPPAGTCSNVSDLDMSTLPIEPGAALLHYRLVERLGAGGMGVVWKAVDTTLDREVAIKILPTAFADDPERLARFEREAKLLASLSHPNVAAVYGLHHDAGVHFLAMELVRGRTLTEEIAAGIAPSRSVNWGRTFCSLDLFDDSTTPGTPSSSTRH
jgi:serine/threonine protein kinase